MHGLVNCAIQAFATDSYGREVWEEVTRRANLEFFDFETMLSYDDAVTPRVLDALSATLNRARNDVMEDIGTYLVSHPNTESLRRLLRFGGVDFVEFLHSLDDLSDRVKLAVSDLSLPEVELSEHSAEDFTLTCRVGPKGYGRVMTGVLRSMADDYGVLAILHCEDTSEGYEAISISLIETDFAEGRQFCAGGAIRMMTLANISDVLDVLCPLHLIMSDDGTILHCGPTLTKMDLEADLVGRRFGDVFSIRRPKTLRSIDALIGHAGKKLHLRLRRPPQTAFKAVLVPTTENRFVVNLSFSISIAEAVKNHALTSSDFPPTDLTIDMLYLIEAQTAAMHASRSLTHRLYGDKIAAQEQAFTDTLTGLRNRRAMDQVLQRLLGWGAPFAVMNIDLDFFKEVNDTQGHAAGDHVLRKMADILAAETRENDVPIRLGGDEFALILPHTSDEETLALIANRIIAAVNDPIVYQGKTCNVSASIGSAIFDPAKSVSVDEVFERADATLYASKWAGRGRHTAFSEGLSKLKCDVR